MDIWESVSIEELDLGMGAMSRMAFMPYSNVVFECTIVFSRVKYCKRRGVIPVKAGIDTALKKQLMNIIDRYNKVCEEFNGRMYSHTPTPSKMEPINANEKLLLTKLCRE